MKGDAAMTKKTSQVSSVIVPVQRLPENIGRLLNQFISGEVITIHMTVVTRDERVVSESAGVMPPFMIRLDRT